MDDYLSLAMAIESENAETMPASAATLRTDYEDPLISQSPVVKYGTIVASASRQGTSPYKASRSKNKKSKKNRFTDLENVDETSSLLGREPIDDPVASPSRQDTSPCKASRYKNKKSKKNRFTDLEDIDETSNLFVREPVDDPVASPSRQDTSPYKASRSKNKKSEQIRYKDLKAVDETSNLLGRDSADDPVASTSRQYTSPYKASRSRTASVDSALDTTLEVQLNKAAENARAAGRSCRNLLDCLYDSLEVIQKEADGYFRIMRVDTRPDISRSPYYRINEKLSAYVDILRMKVEKVETLARNADDTADDAAEKAIFVRQVAPGARLSEIIQHAVAVDIVKSRDEADAATSKAYNEEYMTLRTLRDTLNLVKETQHPEELSDESFKEYEQHCETITRKTRIFHAIIFLAGIVILGLSSLLEVRSDHFYTVIALGVMLLLWSIWYWIFELFNLITSGNTDTSPNLSLRIETISAIDRMRLYERLDFFEDRLKKLDMSFDLTPGSEDSVTWLSSVREAKK